MDDVWDIIYDDINDNHWEMSEVLESVLRWMSTDDVVGWYCDEYYGRDFEDMERCIGEEKRKIIEDYYDLHCN